MAGIEDVPSDWINKAGIAKRHSISRITVDRYLKKIEKDKALSGRLTVKKVKEGKRTFYYYDPTDIDAVFAELNKSKRPSSANVQPLKNTVTNDSSGNTDEPSKRELQKEIEHLNEKIALLEQNNDDLRESMKRLEGPKSKSLFSWITGKD